MRRYRDKPCGPLQLPHTPEPPNVDGTRRACGGPWGTDVCLVAEVIRGAIDEDGADIVDPGEGEGVERRIVLHDVVFDPRRASNPTVDREVGVAHIRDTWDRSIVGECALVLDGAKCLSADALRVMEQCGTHLVYEPTLQPLPPKSVPGGPQ